MRIFWAKTLYHIGGKLSKIKTPRMTYRLTTDLALLDSDEDIPELEFEKAGRSWLPCRLSMKLLGWAIHIDPVHFDHWALVHDVCVGHYCMECKGVVCGASTDD